MFSRGSNMQDFEEKMLKSVPVVSRFFVADYQTVYARRDHANPSHELIYILDGNITLHMDKNLIFNAVPGSLLLIPANVLHRDEFTPRHGLRVLCIHFTWDAPEFFSAVNNFQLLHLDYEARSELQRRLEFMRLHWDDSPAGVFHTTFQLHNILLLLYSGVTNARQQENRKDIPVRTGMHLAMQFINRNYASQITLSDVAEHVGMNASYFSKLFAREFGINYSAYLTATRLKYAKHMLLNTSKQVAEIANSCGFSSSGYFIKVFSRHYGMTPKAYIAQAAKANRK